MGNRREAHQWNAITLRASIAMRVGRLTFSQFTK